MAKVLIVYSTIGGNTELVVQKVTQLLEANHQIDVVRVDIASSDRIQNYDLTILASPTYGQGSIEDHFKPFLKELSKFAKDKEFAVIGLGDTKYYPEYLTEAAGILEEHVKQSGGILIVPPLRIGMPPIRFIDKLVPSWTLKINQILLQKYFTSNS